MAVVDVGYLAGSFAAAGILASAVIVWNGWTNFFLSPHPYAIDVAIESKYMQNSQDSKLRKSMLLFFTKCLLHFIKKNYIMWLEFHTFFRYTDQLIVR